MVSALDKLEEPPTLVALREAVKARLPRVDLPEILLEMAAAPVSRRSSPTSASVKHGPRTCPPASALC